MHRVNSTLKQRVEIRSTSALSLRLLTCQLVQSEPKCLAYQSVHEEQASMIINLECS